MAHANSINSGARRTAMIHTLQAAIALVDVYRETAAPDRTQIGFVNAVEHDVKRAREALLAAIDGIQAAMLNSENPRDPRQGTKRRRAQAMAQ